MNAAVYIRVSTEEQAREGYSIPAQKECLEAFAKSQGWTIVEYYIEEGHSAKDLNRPEVQRLISDIQKGIFGFQVVLVYRLDRLTRSVLDLHRLLEIFEKHRVAFRSATEVYDTTTAIGRLFITLVAAMAQWERENLAERVRMGMAQMARQGRRPGTQEPYGYNYVDGQLVVNPAEAAVVRQIYDYYTRGWGIRRIIRWLNDPEHPIPSKTGKPWHDNTVVYILTNPLYIGKFTWGREDYRSSRCTLKPVPPEYIYQGSHEAIVDEETWHAVQEKLKRRKKLPPRHATGNYPLTGVLKCGLCGGPLNGCFSTQVNRQGKRRVRWYKCSRRDHKQTCSLPYLRAETVEAQVVEMLEQMADIETLQELARQELAAGGYDCRQEAEKLKAELKEISAKKKKWFDAYEAGVIELADLRERMKTITDREAYIRDRLAEIETEEEEQAWTPEERLEKIKNFRWLWEKATPEERKELVHDLIKEIVVAEDKSLTIRLR
jgi:site-specific DNA recombinase